LYIRTSVKGIFDNAAKYRRSHESSCRQLRIPAEIHQIEILWAQNQGFTRDIQIPSDTHFKNPSIWYGPAGVQIPISNGPFERAAAGTLG